MPDAEPVGLRPDRVVARGNSARPNRNGLKAAPDVASCGVLDPAAVHLAPAHARIWFASGSTTVVGSVDSPPKR
jgi:hypothetical protein